MNTAARLTTLLVALATGAMASGCGRSWPTVRPVIAPGFTSGNGTVRTVDVLPADIQVWTYPGSKHSPERIGAGLDQMVSTMVHHQLTERGYDIVAFLDWEGRYAAGPGGSRRAMSPEDLAATVLALSTYGAAQAEVGGQLLVPHLPVRLGGVTGSDATLYVGGWAYAGDDRSKNTGAKVAIGVLAAVLVVGIVVLAVAGGGKGGGGGAGKVLGGAARGVGKGLAAAGKGLVRATGGFGRAAGVLVRGTARGLVRTGIVIGRTGPRFALETVDAFGRAAMHTHIHVQPARVDYRTRKNTPVKGRSSMMMEMTLVDNHSGRVLWHARRRFPASPRKSRQVGKVIRRMLDDLPAVYEPRKVLAGGGGQPDTAAAALAP